MVAGYHLIWTAYGWWLPNDPRGSSSHEIRVEPIADLGELHHGRKRIQPRSSDIRDFYNEARQILQHPLLRFTESDFEIIAASFGRVIADRRYTCYACAVMPDHVHVLIRRHRDKAEQMISALQNASRDALVAAGRRADDHPTWGGPGYKVFLNTRQDFERLVPYVEQNPTKARLPAQRYTFVTRYDGWLPHRSP